MAMLTAAAELDVDPVSTSEPAGLQAPLSPYPLRQLLPSAHTHRGRYGADQSTSSRMLNEVLVTGEEINEIFQLYGFLCGHYCQLMLTMAKILRAMCTIPPHTRSQYAAQRVLFTVAIPLLGDYQRRM